MFSNLKEKCPSWILLPHELPWIKYLTSRELLKLNTFVNHITSLKLWLTQIINFVSETIYSYPVKGGSSKYLKSFSGHTTRFCPNLVTICLWRNLTIGLLWWCFLQSKEGQKRSEFCLGGLDNSFKNTSTSNVRPRDHREDYRSCAWPLYRSSPKHWTLTNKVMGTIWRDLS